MLCVCTLYYKFFFHFVLFLIVNDGTNVQQVFVTRKHFNKKRCKYFYLHRYKKSGRGLNPYVHFTGICCVRWIGYQSLFPHHPL